MGMLIIGVFAAIVVLWLLVKILKSIDPRGGKW